MNAGTNIAHYKILRPLGKGGMGKVYLADDTKLDRQVAIKVLPDAVRQDPERLARFRREAKAAASLNHPNIATIHSIEEADNVLFIVMEYIDGETLSEHIPSDGMEIDVFFDTFIPLADALSHAHQQGRVHRDLKPPNIMIAKDGTPKILDFGLACIMPVVEKVEEANELGSEDETRTLDANQLNKPVKPPSDPSAMSPGPKLMGTPQYMSPEQAESEQLDHRTDIFSFGVVMYEALTGKKAFEASSRISLLGRIVNEDPEPVTSIKPVTPYLLWQVIRQSLRKSREDRTQAARELYTDLCEVQEEIKAGTVLVDAGTIPERQPASDLPLRKFAIHLEAKHSSEWNGPAISPDGSRIVFVHDDRLWVRGLDEITPREISDSEGALGPPGWSPDSSMIVYADKTTIKKVSADGGVSIPLCNRSGAGLFAYVNWTHNGTILVWEATASGGGENDFESVSAQGGDLRPFMKPDLENGEGIFFPYMLPDERGLLFMVKKENRHDLVVQSGDTRRRLFSQDEAILFPSYSLTGHLIYQRGYAVTQGIWALAFDSSTLKVNSEPFPVARNGVFPSVSMDGTLVYTQHDTRQSEIRQLRWVDRTGEIGEPIGSPQLNILSPAISPDGRSVAVSEKKQRNRDIWIYDTVRGTRTRLRYDSEKDDYQPAWSPTGDQVVIDSYYMAHSDLMVVDVDGSEETCALELGHTMVGCPDWSRDGRFLVYHGLRQDGIKGLWHYDFTDDQPPQMFLQGPWVSMPVLSPNGKYVAYQSNESGDWEIYVTRFPEGKGKWQVSVDGGTHPRWNGDELFYVETDTAMLMAVPVESVDVFRMDLPQQLFKVNIIPSMRHYIRMYDVTPDGQRFVVAEEVEQEGAREAPETTIIVVQNWYAEFKEP